MIKQSHVYAELETTFYVNMYKEDNYMFKHILLLNLTDCYKQSFTDLKDILTKLNTALTSVGYATLAQRVNYLDTLSRIIVMST